MDIIRCLMCKGELEIVGNLKGIEKKVKCKKCNFTNFATEREPEVTIIRRKAFSSEDI